MKTRTLVLLAALLLPIVAAQAAEKTGFPEQAKKSYDRGQELFEKGEYREAIDAYNQAIRLGMQDYPRVHLRRAQAYAKLRDNDTVIAQYTDFLDRFGLEDSCRY